MRRISDITEDDYDVFTDQRNKSIGKEDQRRVKKWIRCKEGTEIYSLGRTKLTELAKEAGAVLKIDATILIDREKFDRYLETFRIR